MDRHLNPALHEVNLSEFRRITLAVPFLSLALYGLVKGRRRWILAGLLPALLCQEDMAIIVMAFGVYLLLKNREVKLGGGLLILGRRYIFTRAGRTKPNTSPWTPRAVIIP
jgi:uncharacterized membrane protein